MVLSLVKVNRKFYSIVCYISILDILEAASLRIKILSAESKKWVTVSLKATILFLNENQKYNQLIRCSAYR